MRDVRANTMRVLDAVDDGMLNMQYALESALGWMTDDDVKAMCLANDILIFEDEEDDDE